MAIRQFLAMTPGEMLGAEVLPENLGWMGCQFSASGKGLTQIPEALPKGSLLIITDQTPPDGHDPKQIQEEAAAVVEKLECCGILLDFQRPCIEESAIIAEQILENAPCPVAISEHYSQKLDCPVFLPPVPSYMPPEDFLRPWQGREIWLELALDGMDISVAKDGSTYIPVPYPTLSGYIHQDSQLHCHYSMDVTKDAIRFHLMRMKADISPLLTACEAYGVTTSVGLFQEIATSPSAPRNDKINKNRSG
jgi:hypothetical protein